MLQKINITYFDNYNLKIELFKIVKFFSYINLLGLTITVNLLLL